MKNGQTVAAFERAFADYVGAKYAIAHCNGTATLHTALVALGVKPGDRVAVPPLTMSATTIAVLHAGAVPVFHDVDDSTWLFARTADAWAGHRIAVDLYGLNGKWTSPTTIADAAQTLRRHTPDVAFTSYSFQASKILALGEGGMLVTNDETLATRAREFSSLGYRMRADQPRIDPDALKSPSFDRNYSLGYNYRMNDLTAAEGLRQLEHANRLLADRAACAVHYATSVAGCEWLTQQHIPSGWDHDFWTFAVACDTPERALALSDAIVKHGGERPYPAWKLTYHEPAFRYLNPKCAGTFVSETEPGMHLGDLRRIDGCICPVAESLQQRLLQFQTNDLASAERNATALRKAMEDLEWKDNDADVALWDSMGMKD